MKKNKILKMLLGIIVISFIFLIKIEVIWYDYPILSFLVSSGMKLVLGWQIILIFMDWRSWIKK